MTGGRVFHSLVQAEARRLIGGSADCCASFLRNASDQHRPVPLDIVILAHVLESQSAGPRTTVLAALRRERIRQERELKKAEKSAKQVAA